MPQVSTIISGAASLTVLAGVVSGLFYLVLTGIRWAGRVRAALQDDEQRRVSDQCCSCGRGIAGSTNAVVCNVCGRRSCYGAPCSRPAPIGWNCVLCHVKREFESSSGSWSDAKSEGGGKQNKEGKNIDNETIYGREFVEKLVEKLVGGSLDGVTVGKLSNHPEYDRLFVKYHDQLCQALARLGFSIQFSLSSKSKGDEESPSSAHKDLAQLIRHIISEAETLPDLSKPVSNNGTDHRTANGVTNSSPSLDNKSYEDVLSTAILNKIIEKYLQQNGYIENSRRHSLDDNSNITRTKRNGLSRSQHSLSSWPEDKNWHSVNLKGDPLSLKIEEHIEEVTTTYESSDDGSFENLQDIEDELSSSRRVPFPEYGVDIVDGSECGASTDSESCSTDIISNQSTWEENWLFQRKKLKTPPSSHHPVPVPMLVPNPSQEFRALIGGVDADDISDLSECSDSILEEAMSVTPDHISNDLLIINALNKDDEDDEAANDGTAEVATECPSIPDSTVSLTVSSSLPAAGSDDRSSINSPDSLELDQPCPSPNLLQQDRDIAIDYDAVTQIDRPPIPKPRNVDLVSAQPVEVHDSSIEGSEVEDTEDADDEREGVGPLIGSIAEREKAKWKNAVEMKHNPYTPENIAKRIKNRAFSYSSLSSSLDAVDFPAELTPDEEPDPLERKYSRDYYIQASKSPTGEHRSSDSPVSQRSETSLEWCAIPYRLQVKVKRRWTSMEKLYISDLQGVEMKPTLEVWEDLPAVKMEEVPTEQEPSTPSTRPMSLPNVKELRKSFLSDREMERTTGKPPIPTRRTISVLPKLLTPKPQEPTKEPEIDYSLTPVSEIITNLTNKTKSEREPSNKRDEIFREVAKIRGEIELTLDSSQKDRKDTKDETSVEELSDDTFKEVDSYVQRFRKPMKPVFSLTARSIPKDFREVLKKNSQSTKTVRVEKMADVLSENDCSRPPPLNIDLKGKKKFWEEVIARARN